MNKQAPFARTERFDQVINHFFNLTTVGRQHFITRLIADGKGKPEVKAEIETVLLRLETDFHLKQCWKIEADENHGGPCINQANPFQN